jgi:hypothetical protein
MSLQFSAFIAWGSKVAQLQLGSHGTRSKRDVHCECECGHKVTSKSSVLLKNSSVKRSKN